MESSLCPFFKQGHRGPVHSYFSRLFLPRRLPAIPSTSGPRVAGWVFRWCTWCRDLRWDRGPHSQHLPLLHQPTAPLASGLPPASSRPAGAPCPTYAELEGGPHFLSTNPPQMQSPCLCRSRVERQRGERADLHWSLFPSDPRTRPILQTKELRLPCRA